MTEETKLEKPKLQEENELVKPKMTEEEAKQEIDKALSIRTTLKNLDPIKPSGYVTQNFAILPLGENSFTYVVHDKKGTVSAIPHYTRDSPVPEWAVEIEGIQIRLEGVPLKKAELVFNLPNNELVKKYVKNETKALDTYTLYNKLRMYYKRFLELNDESYYDALVLFTFQTWLKPVLDSVFFLAVTGQFGGGKTTILENVKSVCKHGYIPNPSVAFIGRCMDKLNISLFIDEFDIMGEKDNELYMLVRMCQRRGQSYTRMADKGQSIESFNTFGPCAFTVHGMIEDALETRSVPVYTTETDKKILSKLGGIRRVIGNRLYNDLYLWFFENIINIYGDHLEYVEELEGVMSEFTDDDEANLKIMNRVKFGRELMTTQVGRNSELEDVMLLVLKYLGMIDDDSKVAMVNDLLNAKNEILEQNREVGNIGYLRDALIKLYTAHKGDSEYRTEEGLFMISNIEVSESYQSKMKNKGLLHTYSVGSYRGMMRDLGFDRGKNYKQMRVAVYDSGKKEVKRVSTYIFNSKVQNRLQVKIDNLIPGQQRSALDDFNDKGMEKLE